MYLMPFNCLDLHLFGIPLTSEVLATSESIDDVRDGDTPRQESLNIHLIRENWHVESFAITKMLFIRC